MLRPRVSFTERRRARLARKVDALDALEPRAMITESLGVFTAGIALPTAEAAARLVAARKALANATPKAAKAAARHHGVEIHPHAARHAQPAQGGGHAAAVEVGARPVTRRQATDWLTLLKRRGIADSGVVTLPTIPTTSSSQAGGVLAPRGGIGAAATRPSITPLRLASPDSGGSGFISGSPGVANTPGGVTAATSRPVVGTASRPVASFADMSQLLDEGGGDDDPSRSLLDSPTSGSAVALGEFTNFPLYTLDYNNGVVLFPGFDQIAIGGGTVDLRAQSKAASGVTYSWDTSGLTHASSISTTGTGNYRLQFTWNTFSFGFGNDYRSDTVTLTATDAKSHTEVQTYTFVQPFQVSGTTTTPSWPEAASSDTTLPDGPSFASHNATVDANTGALDATITLPAYSPNFAPLALTYDSLAADARPIIVEHHTLDDSKSTPTKVSAQLTFNGTAGTTYYYDTGQFTPGDVQQIPLEADATALSTGRYAYSVSLGDVRGTTTTSTASGTASVLNYASNAFGAGWTLAGLERITSATGGVILDLGYGGKSLWFAASGGGGAYTSPAGDFSTLALSGGVYTRTMPDGTVYRFDSSGYETSVADRNGLRVTYAYSSGKLSTITDPYTKVTTFHYDGSGKLDTVTDPAGRVTTITHSGSDLTGVTLPDSGGWSYAYDGSHRLTQVTDPRTKTVTVAYDSANRVGTITRPDSTSETFKAAQERGYDTSGTSGSPAPALLLAEARASHADPNGHVNDLRTDWGGLGVVAQATDPDGFVGTRDLDSNGLATTTIDRLNRFAQAAYDAQGNPTTITYHDRTTLLASYNAYTEPTVVTNPRGIATTYTYDSGGNLIGVLDARGGLTTLTYTGNGRLATSQDANGHTTSYAYDSQDRLATLTLPGGATRLTAYDAKGNPATVTDERGNATTYLYDALNRVTGMTDALSNRTTYAYDASGNLTAVQAPLSRTATLAYDSMDRLTTVTDPLSHTTVLGYDSGGNLKTVTDPLSRTTTFAYDAEDRPTVVTDPLTHRTTTAYDAEGQVTAVTDPLSRTTTTAYNSRGWAMTVEDALGNTATYAYDEDGNATTVTPPPNGVLDETVTLDYDELDRLWKRTDALGHATSYAYDAVGNILSAADGNNHFTTYAYDVRDRLTTVTDALSHNTTYGYDSGGNRTSVTDALGHSTATAFDALNRSTTITDANSGVTTMAYDAAGRRTGLTDPVGNRTTWAYDAADRLTTMTDPRGNSTTYAYDVADQLVDVTDRDGRRTTFAYDSGGRWTAERWLTSSGGTVRTTTATYDAAGQLIGLADPDAVLTFAYDSGGRQVTAATTGAAGQPLVTLSYGYDANGKRTSLTDSLASVGRTTYTYDAASRLGSITRSVGGTSGPEVDFTHDAGDRTTKVTRTIGGSGTEVDTTLSYDNANRLTTLIHGVSGGSILATYVYGYDNANRLTGETNAEGSVSYAYDNASQLSGVSGARAETYTYDSGGNRSMSGYATGTGNELTTSPGYTYAYDAEGNRTARTETATGKVTTYAYDYRNRLTGVTQKSSGNAVLMQATYTYDPMGRRIGTDVDADGAAAGAPVQTWMVYDGVNTYADFDGSGSLKTRYLYGPAIDQILARTDSGGTTAWYLPDRIGSVRDLANTSGAIIDHVVYDSYGGVSNETSPSSGDRFKYAAREFDGVTGLYQNRARAYDPSAGRFTSEDPSRFGSGDSNLLRYSLNSPTNFTDPSGLSPFWDKVWGDTLNAVITAATPPFIRDIKTGTEQAIATVTETVQVGGTVWENTGGGTMSTPGRVLTTVGTVVAGPTGVLQVADAVVGDSAVTGRPLSVPERIFHGTIGTIKLVTTATGIKGGIEGIFNCFPAGTLVATIDGPKPIETIRAGDSVWAYELITSEWQPCRVLRTFHRRHDGHVAQISVSGEMIESTLLHPFWVVRGEALEDRPCREHLTPVPADATTSGRWVDACDLKVDDELLLLDGRIAPVTSMQTRPFDDLVYNFEVDRLHCYGVGSSGVLVHNTNGTKETQSIYKAPQPGQGQKQLAEGYHPNDFPATPTSDGKAYFAVEKSLADEYATYFGEGVIEVQIPKDVYKARIAQYEELYQGGPRKQLPIPHKDFDVLNDSRRILHHD